MDGDGGEGDRGKGRGKTDAVRGSVIVSVMDVIEAEGRRYWENCVRKLMGWAHWVIHV